MDGGAAGSGCYTGMTGKLAKMSIFYVSIRASCGWHEFEDEKEEMMLTVTDTVLKQFDKAIANASDADSEDRCLRIVRSENAGGLSLALQSPAPNDTTYEYEGRTVLAVPETYAEFCEDKTLDIDEEGRFTLA
jgi:hypothetical protein